MKRDLRSIVIRAILHPRRVGQPATSEFRSVREIIKGARRNFTSRRFRHFTMASSPDSGDSPTPRPPYRRPPQVFVIGRCFHEDSLKTVFRPFSDVIVNVINVGPDRREEQNNNSVASCAHALHLPTALYRSVPIITSKVRFATSTRA